MALRAVRPHRLTYPADQAIGQLRLVTRSVEPQRHSGVEIAPHRLAVHLRGPRDLSQATATQPQPQDLSDLCHGNLPETHAAPSVVADVWVPSNFSSISCAVSGVVP